jgi:gas vesicle protein GvpL/GvpF
MPDTTATYLYCIVRAARRPATARIPPGVPGGTTPELVTIGRSLWLAAGEVPLDVYGPGMLESRLRDLDWVSEVAVGHEGVIEHFACSPGATVVPMKLLTMFSTRQRAVEDVRRRRAVLNRVIRHISGCEEWGIRVTIAPSAPAAPAPDRRGKTTGAAFLTARREARDAARRAREAAKTAAEAAYDGLERLARDAQVRERRAEPGQNPPLLEAAFLVPARSRARFTAEARRQARACARARVDMALTGPWPAYNFVGGRGGTS